MREHTVKTYSLGELNTSARERAINRCRNLAHENFDVEGLTNSFKEQLQEVGLPTDEVYWRLNGGQGDGVGFYGNVNIEVFAFANRIRLPQNTNAQGDRFTEVFCFKISKCNRHYDHENSGRATADTHWSSEIPQSWVEKKAELLVAIKIAYAFWSNKLEAQGYEEIRYQTDDKQVIENIESNNIEFYADGTIYSIHEYGEIK